MPESKIYCGDDGRWHVMYEGKEMPKTYDHAPDAQKALGEMRLLTEVPKPKPVSRSRPRVVLSESSDSGE